MFLIIGPTILDILIAKTESLPVVCGDEFTQSSFIFCDKPINTVMGGNGGNSACALARLGANVTLCSTVGKDTYGDILFKLLTESGVNVEGVVRKDEKRTSTTSLLSDKKLNRIAFHYPGISGYFSLSDIDEAVLDKAEIVLITGYTLLPQLRFDGIEHIIKQLKKNNATVALDIGPAVNKPVKLKEIGSFIENVDYLLCNEYELMQFAGADNVDNGIEIVKDAHENENTVIIKCGNKGARILDKKQKGAISIESFKVEPYITVGAGDAFNAGFLYGIGENRNLQETVKFANAVAASVISSERGVLNTPKASAIDFFLSSPDKAGI